jgi:hypothetical protein
MTIKNKTIIETSLHNAPCWSITEQNYMGTNSLIGQDNNFMIKNIYELKWVKKQEKMIAANLINGIQNNTSISVLEYK